MSIPFESHVEQLMADAIGVGFGAVSLRAGQCLFGKI
jgi:hypothetical protein